MNNPEQWVVISAGGVAGIYAYRRLTETPGAPPVTARELVGVGELPPLGPWTTAWGFTFLVVAIIASAAPELGAAFAILILVGDVMANSTSIFGDIGRQASPTPSSAVRASVPPSHAAPAGFAAVSGHSIPRSPGP